MPIVAILVFDLDVEKLDTSRRNFRSHIQMREWQLASEEHSRTLRLLSEATDDQMVAAVHSPECERQVVAFVLGWRV